MTTLHAKSFRGSTLSRGGNPLMSRFTVPIRVQATPSTSYTAPSPAKKSEGSQPQIPVTTTPAVRTNYRVSLFDALKFGGPAPELVNARLAMIGIIAVAYNETLQGEPALEQLKHVPLGTFLLLAVGVVYASLAPILRGVKQEAFGPFSPRAEIINGRAAMIGFAVLCGLEISAGVPFF